MIHTFEPLREFRRIDNTCGTDAEVIPFNASGFLREIRAHMRTMTLPDLHRHYPELTFVRVARVPGTPKRRPRGYDMVEDLGRAGHMCASWRH